MKRLDITTLTLIGFFINLAYAAYHAVIGLMSYSWWLITLCVYYTLLSVMRFATLQIKRRDQDIATERFVERFTGIMFVLMAVCLVGTVILAAVNERGVKHHEIVMITIALYTFIKITLAIINLVKVKQYSSPVFKALRSISFADALVSVFSLQRSMLVSFEGMSDGDIRLFNILTGSAVCVIVFVLGLHLIGGKYITMATSKIVKANEKIADAVVSGYKKIEGAVVDGYTKIEDKFVDAYLTRDGETVEEAKARLKQGK